MKRFIATALVLLFAMPSVAQAADDRRRNAGILLGMIAAAAAVLWIATETQTTTRTVQLVATDGGERAAGTWSSRGSAASGPLTLTLGGQELHGRWTELDSSVDLSTILVTTPTGPITAVGLTESGAPTGVWVVDGPDAHAVCAWTGSFDAGVVQCADSHGHHYIGNW